MVAILRKVEYPVFLKNDGSLAVIGAVALCGVFS
jgi:hypothetical protein